MKYEQWRKNAIRFVAMTGYSVEQFLELLPYFEQAHYAYFTKFQINGRRRTGARKFVLYANSPLPTVAERLAFILPFLKLNPLQEHHAALFGMEQKQCYSSSTVSKSCWTRPSALPACCRPRQAKN